MNLKYVKFTIFHHIKNIAKIIQIICKKTTKKRSCVFLIVYKAKLNRILVIDLGSFNSLFKRQT